MQIGIVTSLYHLFSDDDVPLNLSMKKTSRQNIWSPGSEEEMRSATKSLPSPSRSLITPERTPESQWNWEYPERDNTKSTSIGPTGEKQFTVSLPAQFFP